MSGFSIGMCAIGSALPKAPFFIVLRRYDFPGIFDQSQDMRAVFDERTGSAAIFDHIGYITITHTQ